MAKKKSKPKPKTAPAASPTFGGAPPGEPFAAAAEAKSDPGFVVAKPLLTTGAYGHDVAVLAQLLEAAGHPNAVAAGLEPPMLTDELMHTVREFQEDQGIDPTAPQAGVEGDETGPPLVRKDHEGIVEWRTWKALFEAAGHDVEGALHVAAIRYPKGSFA